MWARTRQARDDAGGDQRIDGGARTARLDRCAPEGGRPIHLRARGRGDRGSGGAGIPFEIIPGVTTPLGLAAYTGVPLTHRDHSSVVTFVTGHRKEAIDWSKTGTSGTVVLFMGMVNFAAIAREMIAHGRSPETPAMAVRWATRPDQETLVGTLETLPGIDCGARLAASGDHRRRRGGGAA